MGSCSCLDLKNTIPTMRPQLRFRARDDKCIAWTRLGILFGKDQKKTVARMVKVFNSSGWMTKYDEALGLWERDWVWSKISRMRTQCLLSMPINELETTLHVGVPVQRNGCQSMATEKWIIFWKHVQIIKSVFIVRIIFSVWLEHSQLYSSWSWKQHNEPGRIHQCLSMENEI